MAKISKKDIKWVTMDSFDGLRTLKQHAYYPDTRKRPYTFEGYPGNRQLCRFKTGVGIDEDEFEDWNNLENENIQPNPCVNCLRIFGTLGD